MSLSLKGDIEILYKIMASNIGTNFSYRAKDFLDDRQGYAKSKKDLKDWNIPVPESFEICLDGVWYYYNSELDLKETGHWIPKVPTSVEEVVDKSHQSISAGTVESLTKGIEDIKKDIKDMGDLSSPVSMTALRVGPKFTSTKQIDEYKAKLDVQLENCINFGVYIEELDLNKDNTIDTTDILLWNQFINNLKSSSLTPGNSTSYTLDLGSSILPNISWRVVKPKITWHLSGSNVIWKIVPGSDKDYIDPTKSVVTSEIKGILEPNLTSWTATEIIKSNNRKTYTIKVYSELGSKEFSVEGYVYIQFMHKTFTGVGDIKLWESSTINSKTGLPGFGERFVSNGTLGETYFNCTGGKYPYILIPKELYSSSYKTYVNKNLNSDFLIKDITLVNKNGISIPYKLYRTNYIQTGSRIGIEIK